MRPGAAARTIGMLALLQVTLPLDAAVTAAALLTGRSSRPEPSGRTILVSGGKMTKALQLARSFHADGHRVVLVEAEKYRLTGHRFSRAVDAFHVVPEPQAPGYAEALLDLVRSESVDTYVPVCSPVASHFDAEAKKALAEHCEVLHVDADVVDRLDDKFQFFRTATALGLPVPATHRITDPAQVVDLAVGPRTWVLKSIAYDPVRRLDLTRLPLATDALTAAFAQALPISEDNPWILQEFVEGTEYCTHGTVRGGRLQVHCCCESSPFQINYAHVEKPAVLDWVTRFVGALELTGQVSFDFIETAAGELFAIECNPRTHSAITMFYDHPRFAAAYLTDDVELVQPLASSRATYWIYHEVWRALKDPRRSWRVVREGKDAIFAWDDPLPFFMAHHVEMPRLLLQNLLAGRTWIRMDLNIGKLVEPAGD